MQTGVEFHRRWKGIKMDDTMEKAVWELFGGGFREAGVDDGGMLVLKT